MLQWLYGGKCSDASLFSVPCIEFWYKFISTPTSMSEAGCTMFRSIVARRGVSSIPLSSVGAESLIWTTKVFSSNDAKSFSGFVQNRAWSRNKYEHGIVRRGAVYGWRLEPFDPVLIAPCTAGRRAGVISSELLQMDLLEEVRNGGEWADSDAGGYGLAEVIWALGSVWGR